MSDSIAKNGMIAYDDDIVITSKFNDAFSVEGCKEHAPMKRHQGLIVVLAAVLLVGSFAGSIQGSARSHGVPDAALVNWLQSGPTPPPARPPSRNCTLVELYPGYPGYRGYVTGVDGIGDHACLQDLVEMDATFNRAREDQQNRQAAQRLGIDGTQEIWVWENWMAIEGERGLPVTCYSCALYAAPMRSEPAYHNVKPNDPRLQVGTFGWTGLYSQYASKLGIPTTRVWDDYEVRAVVNLFFTPVHLNALQLLEAYEIFVGIEYCVDGPPCIWVDVEYLACSLAEQGGYVPTPSNAVIEDQVFTFGAAVYGISIFLNPLAAQSFLQQSSNIMEQWVIDTTSGKTSQSLIQYAKANNFAGGALTC